jgi:hypothetical protein
MKRSSIIQPILWALTAGCLISGQALGGNMEIVPLYTMKEFHRNVVPAEEYKSKEWLYTLFPVPEENVLGTNTLFNGITLLKLEQGKVIYKPVKKNIFSYLSSGAQNFTPVFSIDTIGFAQTRAFFQFNLITKEHISHMVCTRIEEDIDGVKVVDGPRRIFLFKIDWSGKAKIFRLTDLSTDKVKVLGEMRVESDTVEWDVNKGVIYLYRDLITAYDLNFKPISQPFDQFVKSNRDIFGDIVEIFFHPEHPFAILLEFPSKQSTKSNSWVITWTPKNEFKIFNLFWQTSAGGFQCSPDGKFVVFEGFPAHPGTYFAMKVDPKLPHYLSTPMPMGQIPQIPNGVHAWTTKPMGFVVSAGDKLIRYDLEQMREVRMDELVEIVKTIK